LTLVEGKHGTGKSVFCQHLVHSALDSGKAVAFYSSETASPSLISQMSSLGLDVLDYFLLDKLRVFPLELPAGDPNPARPLDKLIRHMTVLPLEFDLIIVDSLTGILPLTPRPAASDFFAGARQLCQEGRTVVLTVDPRALATSWGSELAAWSDIHLRLKMQTVTVQRVVKSLELCKTNRDSGGYAAAVNFDVFPGRGMGVVWARQPD
jgi:archaellum biogenesis ATPase FlaH